MSLAMKKLTKRAERRREKARRKAAGIKEDITELAEEVDIFRRDRRHSVSLMYLRLTALD